MKKKPVVKHYVEFNTKYCTEYGKTVSKGYDFIFAVDILIADCYALGGAKKLKQFEKIMDVKSTQELFENGLALLRKKVPVSKKTEKIIMTAINKQEMLETDYMIKPKWKLVKSKEENTKVVNKLMDELKTLGDKFEFAEDVVADLLESIELLDS